MEKLKHIDYELFLELIKDARRSDRTFTKALKVSQPTVTRRRAILERELIEGYTAIPRWEKLGYEIFAMTFVKIRTAIGSKQEYNKTREKAMSWLMNQPNIIMSGACRGIGMDSFMISVHRSYKDYDEFMRSLRLELGDFMEDVQSVLVNLGGKELLKPLNFKYLAGEKR